MQQTIDSEFDQMNERARSLWRCHSCNTSAEARFSDLAEVGPPICSECGDDLALSGIVIQDTTPSPDASHNVNGSLAALPAVDTNEIRVFVRGGNVQGIDSGSAVPTAISVMVVDYDVDGMTADEIADECCRDEDGDHCIYRNA